MNSTPTLHRSRGASLIELLLVIGVIVVLIVIVGNMMTGTGGKEGVKQKAERRIQEVNFYTVYQGFYVYGSSQENGKYPSTKSDGRMTEDTTSAVFGLLVQDGYLAGPQLISPNEYSSDISQYTMGDFTPDHTSFCLNDYDADDWLRYRDWGTTQNSQYVLLSDRWFDDPSAPEGIHNLQADVDVPGYWHALFGDGHSDQIRSDPVRPNGDHLFEPNPDLKELDALMVRD